MCRTHVYRSCLSFGGNPAAGQPGPQGSLILQRLGPRPGQGGPQRACRDWWKARIQQHVNNMRTSLGTSKHLLSRRSAPTFGLLLFTGRVESLLHPGPASRRPRTALRRARPRERTTSRPIASPEETLRHSLALTLAKTAESNWRLKCEFLDRLLPWWYGPPRNKRHRYRAVITDPSSQELLQVTSGSLIFWVACWSSDTSSLLNPGYYAPKSRSKSEELQGLRSCPFLL